MARPVGRPPLVSLDDEEAQVKAFKKLVYQQAMSGKNVAYARLFADMTGLIKQRSEEKPKEVLDADSIIAAIKGASDQGIGGVEGTGVGEMPGRRMLLRPEIRNDKGRSKRPNPVRAVPPPDEPPSRPEDAPSGGDSES